MLSVSATLFLLLGNSPPSAPAPNPAPAVARLNNTLETVWKDHKVTPAPPADDASFLRRAWLDLAGRVPPPEQARFFLDDTRPDKRARLIERLLASSDFADHWGRVLTLDWTDRRPVRQDSHDGQVLNDYLRSALADGKSYRAIVREVLTGSGLQDESGPVNFLLRYEGKPADLAGAVGRRFMGTTLHCAQCHDHFLAPWKQADFWGLAAFFARVRRVNIDDDAEVRFGILERLRGELEIPDVNGAPDPEGNKPKKIVRLRFPGKNVPVADGPRRRLLADWLTADSNPYFAGHAVNRVWFHLFGKPLVPNLDRLEETADGPHAAILEQLTSEFKSGGTDLKFLLRIIVSSRAYQTASTGKVIHHFAGFPVRPLAVDPLFASITGATGYRGPEPENGADKPDEDDRALDTLGERAQTLQRTLVLLNSDHLHTAAQKAAEHAIEKFGRKVNAAHIDWLFLSTLSRRPTREESAALLEAARSGEAQDGLADAAWALLNSVEFLTNH
jgi:hypothetical protein